MFRNFFLLTFSLFCLSASAVQVESFAKYSDIRQIKISPDGKSLVAIVINENDTSLVFFDVEPLQPKGKISFSYRKEPGELHWVNSERIVFKLMHKKPWKERPEYYGQLYSVNQNGKKAELIYGYNAGESQVGPSAKKRKKSISGWANIINLLPEDPKHILIQSTPYSRDGSSHPKALMLNVYNGVIKNSLESSPIPASDLFTDSKGNVRLAVGTSENYETEIRFLDPQTQQWENLFKGNYGDGFHPLTISADDQYLYALDDHKKDKTGLYKINLQTGKRTLMFRDKTVSITNALLTTDKQNVLAVRFDPDYPNYALVPGESEEHRIFRNMLATFPGQSVDITSRSQDGFVSLIRVSGDTNPGTYYLYNRSENKLRELFKRQPHIDSEILSPMSAFQFTTNDGFEIHGYLTLPKDRQRKKLPVVIMPHGGPHNVRDYWGYDSEVQALASQGYAVLQVNYRGSGGYGQKFTEAGYLEWGGNIQKDILQAALWATEQEIADPEKICIMGASFGAYSAVQAAVIAPDVFQCVIANVGIYDLELLREHDGINDIYGGKAYLDDVIGNNVRQLRHYSPINAIDKLKSAIFIAHGEKDRRAPIEHAEALKAALKKNNKPFEWFAKQSEGHGFYSEKNQAEYLSKVIDFLDLNIGNDVRKKQINFFSMFFIFRELHNLFSGDRMVFVSPLAKIN